MSQPRHKRKQRIDPTSHIHDFDGRAVHVGEKFDGYEAELCVIDDAGRTLLKRIGFLHACARVGSWVIFQAALDLPIAGCRNWWMISDVPVEISRHTSEFARGKSYTRQVMELLGYAPAA